MKRWINFIFLFVSASLFAQNNNYPAQSAIATPHYLATQTAVQILAEGGNAFDAAVSVAAVLGVVQPYAAGLGGGSFWLLHDANTNQDIFVDAREEAPSKANNAQLTDKNSVLHSGIPGTPAALDYIAHHYGKLSFTKILEPAIHYAQHGFAIDDRYLFWFKIRQEELWKNPAARHVFFERTEMPTPKIWITQPALANTLTLIAKNGSQAFYRGSLAKKIINAVQQEKGVWTLADLRNYQLKIRLPLREKFKDFTFVTIGEPSAGGYNMIAMLQGLQGYPQWKQLSYVDQVHLFAELMRRANMERQYYADPAVVHHIPTLAPDRFYPGQPMAINLQKATLSEDLAKEAAKVEKGEHTTFFVIVDKQGNRAAVNLTLNDMFGSAVMISTLGVLLNNELTDFTTLPTTTPTINQIEPEKRPLSTMSPSFYEDSCRLIILGTPGGKRIASMQFLALASMLHNNSLQKALNLPRFNQSFLPDVLEVESKGFDENTLAALRQKGHHIEILDRQYGDMEAVEYNRCTQEVKAATDPRGVGFAVVF